MKCRKSFVCTVATSPYLWLKGALLSLSFTIFSSGALSQDFSPAEHDKTTITTVTVPAGSDWKPFSYIDDNGRLMGTDVDILRNTLTRMNYALNYIPDIPQRRFIDTTGKLGFNALLGATYTPERAEKYHFSDPYRSEKVVVFFLDDELEQVQSLEELLSKGYVGALNLGAYYGDEFEHLRVQYYHSLFHNETPPRRLKQLLAGRVDFVIDDLDNFSLVVAEAGVESIKRSPFYVIQTEVRFMFSKEQFDNAFISLFNLTMADLLKTDEEQK